MTDTHEHHYTDNVQEHLHQVQHLLEKQALVETVVHNQELPRDERHELLEKMLQNSPWKNLIKQEEIETSLILKQSLQPRQTS